jgi:hypothetical protein
MVAAFARSIGGSARIEHTSASVCSLSHHRLTRRLNDPHQPEYLNAEVVTIAEANRIQARVGFNDAVCSRFGCGTLDVANRTPATKSKMAERILRTAADGVTDPRQLMAVAIEEGSQPAE